MVPYLIVILDGLFDQVGVVALQLMEDHREEAVQEVIDVILAASRPTIASRSAIVISVLFCAVLVEWRLAYMTTCGLLKICLIVF